MNSMRIKVRDVRRLKVFCFGVFFIVVMLLQNRWLYSYDYPNVKSVIVSPGDTLWNIAAEYKSEEQDIRGFIHKIAELNSLNTSELFEGQEIKVPIQEE